MRLSIRKQLLTLFMPILFGLWIACAIVSNWLVSSFSEEYFDRDLINSADSVVARLRKKDAHITIDLPPAAQAILKRDNTDKIYYRVLCGGETISGDAELPQPRPLRRLDEPELRTISIAGKEVILVEVETDVDGEKAIVQVAQTTNVRKNFKQIMLISVAGPQLLVFGIGVFAVWNGVGKILTPLQLLQVQLGKRTPSDLSSLSDAGVPEEVAPLVTAINNLLERLAVEINAHQRFISNAAHQLRTPLAGLKTYSSIGTEMTEPDDLKHIIREVDQGIDRASRMVAQLLALARADGVDTGKNVVRTKVDLNFIVSDVTAELIEQVVRKDLALLYEPAAEPAIIYGEQAGLRHLVANLVENAIAYTPAGGQILVKVRSLPAVSLSVVDNGIGIPLSERDKVFERFYRVVGASGDGSGLGLSIVKEVANAHSGKIQVDSGPRNTGTSITIEFAQL